MWLRRTGGCTCAYMVGSIYIAEFVRLLSVVCCMLSQNSRWCRKWVARKVARLPSRVEESTPRPKGRWVCEARRHALPACGSDIPRLFNVSTAHPVGFKNGREREREGCAGAPRRTGRMNREGEVCSLVTCGVHFGARRRASARRRCVPRQLRLSIRSSECCGTREEAHRHNGNANRRDGINVRTCALFSIGSTTQVSTAISHW